MTTRILHTLLLLTLTAGIALAQSVPADPGRKKVGLVLGGGGAKGAAEVGVLKVLEEVGMPIDYIAGTSIGAIVGGLYSIGYNANDLDSLIRNQDWLFLLSDGVRRKSKSFMSKKEKEKYLFRIPVSKKRKMSLPTGYVAGQNITNLFSSLTVGYHQVDDFSQLPIPFRCVAVNLVDGSECVLSSGSLPQAMRASMSIPGVFAPVELDGKLLIDGGALNNLPVDVVRQMGADVVICVDLNTGLKDVGEIKSLTGVVNRLIDIMGQTKYNQNKPDASLYINPSFGNYSQVSFQREAIDSMICWGEQAARTKLPELLELKKLVYNGHEPDTAVFRPQKPQCDSGLVVRNIRVEGLGEKESRWVKSRMRLKENSLVSQDDINRALDKLRGLDIFQLVEYRLENCNPYDLIFHIEPKEHQHINIGARFDTEELAAVIANISNNQQLSTYHHYSLTGRISLNPYLQAEYNYGHLYGSKLGFAYKLAYHDFDVYADKKKMGVQEFISHSLSGYYSCDIGNFRMKSGAQFAYCDYQTPLYMRDGIYNGRTYDHFVNYFADLTLDTYDNRHFPTRGSHVQLQGMVQTDNGAQYDGGSPFFSVALSSESACKLGSRLCVLPSINGRILWGNSVPAIYQNCVGGNFNSKYLPWQNAWESARQVRLLRNCYAATRLTLRYRVRGKFHVSLIGEYGRESHEAKDFINDGHALWGCALKASYDHLLGPVSFQINYSNLDKNAGMFINAGFYF